jgi:SAM-dependent methyltransferase
MKSSKITAAIKKNWDDFGQIYEEMFENVTLQSSSILYSVTNARNPDRICEVGVGCGLASRMFISNIMKENSAYFASDLSTEMNKAYVDGFYKSDIAFNPKTILNSIEDNESVDVDNYINEVGSEYTKKVFSLAVNNEVLPYPDASFDMYLSSLSMMIVDNHHAQISEAYRVLKEGSTAGFTVWGRAENSTFFSFMQEAIVASGIKMKKAERTNFHLGDKDALVSDLKAGGFSEVRAYYTMTNSNMTADQYYYSHSNSPGAKLLFQAFSEEQRALVKETFYKMYEERYNSDSTDLFTWEILFCIAKK